MICFSVFGYPDKALVLVLEIVPLRRKRKFVPLNFIFIQTLQYTQLRLPIDRNNLSQNNPNLREFGRKFLSRDKEQTKGIRTLTTQFTFRTIINQQTPERRSGHRVILDLEKFTLVLSQHSKESFLLTPKYFL